MKVNHHHYLHVGEDIFGSIAGFLSYLEKSIMNELEILKAQIAANTTAIENATATVDKAVLVIGGFKAQLDAAIAAAQAGDMAPLTDLSNTLAAEDAKLNAEIDNLNTAMAPAPAAPADAAAPAPADAPAAPATTPVADAAAAPAADATVAADAGTAAAAPADAQAPVNG